MKSFITLSIQVTFYRALANPSMPPHFALAIVLLLLPLSPASIRAQTIASGSLDLESLTATTTSGSILWSGDWSLNGLSSVFSTDGGPAADFNNGSTSVSVAASALYASAHASSAAPVIDLTGLTGHVDGMVNLPGGFDQLGTVGDSGNFSSLKTTFSITGGPTDVSFAATISSLLNAVADPSGTVLRADTVFNLIVDSTTLLSFSDLLSASPGESFSRAHNPTLGALMSLDSGTHVLFIELDTEQQAFTVPEQGETRNMLFAGLAAMAFGAASRKRGSLKVATRSTASHSENRAKNGTRWNASLPAAVKRAKMTIAALRLRAASLCLFFLSLTCSQLKANYIGGERPFFCKECGAPQYYSYGSYGVGFTEGNLKESMPISSVGSATAPTIDFNLTYNSYNADGSHAMLNTVLGYGWTHSYNILLFSQVGSLFRMDEDGRTEKFQAGPGGTYSSDAGYFETLVKNPDGSFTLTTKDGTVYTFALVSGTPFIIGGPVYRLQSMVDRNNNTNRLTYAGGNLVKITDTYGRVLQFSYNSQNQLTQLTDPLGRVTTFAYDTTGRRLSKVTDPLGKTTTYTYNTLNQVISKVDRDGRTFTYQYQNNLPTGIKDGSSNALFSLSNTSKWATSFSDLGASQERLYVPSTSQQTDGRGNIWKYQYDQRGFPTNSIGPDGTVTRYTYDPTTLRVATMTDPNGNTTSYQYDSRGNRSLVTDALGHQTAYTYEPVFNQIASMTDPKGRITTYQYDVRGNLIQEMDPLGQTRSWTYDTHGNVLTETDKRGNTTQYQYDSFGQRTRTIDALGNVTLFAYDAVGNLISRADANNHTNSYQYDGLNRLIKETDPASKTTQTFYDSQGNRVRIIDRNGNQTTYQYDVRGRPIQTTDALGHTDKTAYDANDNVISTIDRNGHTNRFNYDTRNRLVKTIDAVGNSSLTTYEGAGNILSQTDANGHTTTYTYDVLNRRVTSTDAMGNVARTAYDTGGPGGCPTCGVTPGSALVTREQDGNGKVTFFKYDELDRRVQIIRKVGGTNDTLTASDAVTSYAYDPNNNRLTVTEPNGNTSTNQFDALNRRIRESNAVGDTTVTAYDGVGNVISITSPNSNITTETYDSLDRLIQVIDTVGLVATYAYDNEGNRISQTDGNGSITRYGYDSVNRLISTTDALSQTSTSQYDAAGNLIQVTDRNGNSTVYGYDAINRRILTTDALGHQTQFQYDSVGNLTRIIDANGHSTQYAYDPDNRLILETYADGLTRSFTYDAVGNRLSRTDQIGQVTGYNYNDLYFLLARTYPSALNDTFTYDLSGRMLTAQRGAWGVSFAYDGADRILQTVQNGENIAYSYNILGGTRQVTYPGGRVVTEQLDLRNRLAQIDDAGSPPPIVEYVYDLGNRVVTRTYGNGTMATYTYNSNNWVLNLEHSFGPTLIAGFAYSYDHENNKGFESKLHDATHSECYAYDTINRLITYKVGTLVGSCVAVPVTQTTYNLDAVGNWISRTINGTPELRTHNTVNELTSINATFFTYDADGDLRNDGFYTYAYDEENRLIQVTRNADAAIVGQNQYDALGRRVQKFADPAGTTIVTRYFYDDLRILEEQDGAGTTEATYVYGGFIDEVLTMDRGGQAYYYHQNPLWSVEAVTDGSANPIERYAYDAYGFPSITDGAGVPVPPNPWGTPHSAIDNPGLFTGRQLDEETGLYFYRARYYDSIKGRFLQRDPEGYKFESPASEIAQEPIAPEQAHELFEANLYLYAGDNPINYLDPLGLWKYAFNVDKANKKAIGHIIATAEKGDTLEALSTYWTKSDKNVQKILDANGIKKAPAKCDGLKLDLFAIMPEFYQDQVGKKPKDGPNCWNAALAFHGLIDGPAYTSGAVAHDKLLKNATPGASKFAGDIVVWTSDRKKPKANGANASHFAVYLADDWVFTKNGYASSRYKVMKLGEVNGQYGQNIGRWSVK